MAAATAARAQRASRAPRAHRAVRPRPRPAPARRAPKRQPTAWLVPVAAVGRTAVAVGGIADSGLVYRLTRGRLWIGLLGALLVGIVGLNVVALSFSASSSGAAREADEVKRQNSALEAQLASLLSAEEIERVADDLGLHVPAPGAIRYVKPSPDDAAIAAKRLRDGDLTTPVTPPVEATVPTVTDTVTTATDPATTAPVVDPATAAPVEPAVTTPVPETAPVTDPAVTAPAPAAATVGGVASP